MQSSNCKLDFIHHQIEFEVRHTPKIFEGRRPKCILEENSVFRKGVSKYVLFGLANSFWDHVFQSSYRVGYQISDPKLSNYQMWDYKKTMGCPTLENNYNYG
jgi:hypothetical protein